MRMGYGRNMGISKAREVLGNQYAESVIIFFENLMSSDFDYIVLLSRRCFVLYRIFSRLLGEGIDLERGPKVITDKAIALLPQKKELQSKNCLIVDDILIHGRAVSRVYKALRGLFSQLRVYVCGKSIDCYQGLPEDIAAELIAHTCSERVETAASWKILSERLVSLIHIYDEPYTSFLMSMRTYGCSGVARFVRSLEYGVPGWEMHRCYHDQDEAVDPMILFEGQLPGFFSKYCDQACVRIYCRPGTGSLCITPTAFPKTIPARLLDNFMQALIRELPDSMAAVKVLLGSESDGCAQSFDDLRYRLAAAVLSALYGVYAVRSLRRAGLDIPELDPDLAPLEYSFSPELAECVRAQLGRDNSWLNAPTSEFLELSVPASFPETQELVESLRGCLKARTYGAKKGALHKAVWDGFLEYFFLNGIRDERAVLHPIGNRQDICRDIGLSTPNMMDIAQGMGLSKNSVCANLIAAWDTGRASMDALMYRTGDGQKYYSTFSSAGERSYRTVNEYLGYHVVNMQRIEDLLLCWYGMQGPSCAQACYSSSLERALKEYCKRAKERFGWTEAVCEAIEQFIEFLISEKVPVSDYVVDFQDDMYEDTKGIVGDDCVIAEFGENYLEQLIAQGV